MAISLVTHAEAGSTTGSNVTTSGVDTTGAKLLVLAVGYNASGGAPTISDSKGNTWTPLTERAGLLACRLYYCLNPTVGSGHTFTGTKSNGRLSLGVVAFSGDSLYDSQENGASAASGTSLATGSITPTENDCLVVSGLCVEIPSSGASINGTGFTAYTVDAVLAQHVTFGIAWKVQATAGAENRTWSWTQSRNCAAAIASFKSVAGGKLAAANFYGRLIGGREATQ